jgi:hypothetical protein
MHRRHRRNPHHHRLGSSSGAPEGYAYLTYKDANGNYRGLTYKDAAGNYRLLAYKVA